MNVDQKVIDRLSELIRLGEQLKQRLIRQENINQLHATWKVSSQAVLRQTFGEDSEYFTSFRDYRSFNQASSIIPRLGILEAAQYGIGF